jgi:TolB protein
MWILKVTISFMAVLAMAAPVASATFPGPNGKIAYEGNGNTIRLMNPDGSGPFQPFKGAVVQASPAFSPDGRLVAFDSGRNIWVGPADGSSPAIQVTKADANDKEPAFSPDGQRLAFQRGLVGNGEIFIVRLDGTGLVNVSNDAIRIDSTPDWSPDGSRIAYTGDECFTDAPQGGPCVFVMNADGSGKVNLTPEEKRAECDNGSQAPGYSHAHHSSDPSWSPDGSRIAFTGYYDLCMTSLGGGEIWTMNPDGSGKTNVTKDVALPDAQPAFSPDGSTIVFYSTNRDGKQGLFTIPAGGGAPTRLTTGEDPDPNWGRVPPAGAIVGSSAGDVLFGTRGKDTIKGGAGKDRLFGGPGADKLEGGPGTDVINCGAGRDTAIAGKGDKLIGCEKVKRAKK